MQFNWEEFMNRNNKIAVHCETEREANDFCREMAEHGMRWCNRYSYIEKTEWDIYEEETCYTNTGYFARKNFYEEKGYKILKWSDYMKKCPIDYLKYGYVVEFENGKLGMYMPSQNGDCFDLEGEYNCIYVNDFKDKENLKNGFFNFKTIIKIYGYSKYGSTSRKIKIENRPLIWERPEEVKKMTVSEICKELGYRVEIIAEEK